MSDDIRELLRHTNVCEDMAGTALALILEQDAELVVLRQRYNDTREQLNEVTKDRDRLNKAMTLALKHIRWVDRHLEER
jgi:hypothetical protein